MARFFIPSTLLLALYLGLSFAGEDWKGELLNAENQHRNVHGVEPLHYNDEVINLYKPFTIFRRNKINSNFKKPKFIILVGPTSTTMG